MKQKKLIKDLPVLGILSLCASFVLSQALLSALNGTDPLQTLVLCIPLIVCWSLLLLSFPAKLVVAAGVTCTFLWGIWSLLFASGSSVFGNTLRTLWSYLSGKAAVRPEHLTFLPLVICITVTLYISIFTVWVFHFPMIAALGLSLFVWRHVSGNPLSFELFGSFLVLCLLYWLFWADKLRAREENTQWRPRTVLLLFGLPICLLCVFLARLLPVPSAPLRDKEAEQETFTYVLSRLERTEDGDGLEEGTAALDTTAPQEDDAAGGGGSSNGGSGEQEPPEPEEPEPESESEEEPVPPKFSWRMLAVIAALALLLLVWFAVLRLWMRRRWIRRLATLAPEASVPLLFAWLLAILHCLKLLPHRGETLNEFTRRVGRVEYLPPECVKASIDGYLPVRYGGRHPDDDLRDRLLASNLEILEVAKRHVGTVRFLLFAVLGWI